MTDNQKFPIPVDDGASSHLQNIQIPSISLQNQEGNLLRLDRTDTFRMIFYFFPMTGRPDMPLPKEWNRIPGANGCTLETCKFRDHYFDLIGLNAVPIGISTQNVEYNKEMTKRLAVPFDILSDENLELKNALNLPTFTIKNKMYLKRLTLIIEKKIVKKVFYPIYPISEHINDLIRWLKVN